MPRNPSTTTRYMDIMLGLCLLVSLVSLEYGSMAGERAPLALFLILSTVVYWLELLKYAAMDQKVSYSQHFTLLTSEPSG